MEPFEPGQSDPAAAQSSQPSATPPGAESASAPLENAITRDVPKPAPSRSAEEPTVPGEPGLATVSVRRRRARRSSWAGMVMPLAAFLAILLLALYAAPAL